MKTLTTERNIVWGLSGGSFPVHAAADPPSGWAASGLSGGSFRMPGAEWVPSLILRANDESVCRNDVNAGSRRADPLAFSKKSKIFLIGKSGFLIFTPRNPTLSYHGVFVFTGRKNSCHVFCRLQGSRPVSEMEKMEIMATCRNRENKRQALIEATGKLLVEMGDARAVGTRAIVAYARTSKSAIDYRFSNKAGLLNAVLNELQQLHGSHCIADFLRENEKMLENRDGQIQFISLLLDEFQNYFRREEKNTWYILLRRKVVQSYYEIGNCILTSFFEADMKAFYTVFKKVTGRDDVNEAYAWFMNIMLPLSTRGFRKNQLTFNGEVVLSPDYDGVYLEFCKRQLMAGWGLISFSDQLGVPSGGLCCKGGA